MRVSLSNKVRLVFLAMTVITLTIGAAAVLSNHYISNYVDKLSAQKDFQVCLERLKTIQLRFESTGLGAKKAADAFAEEINRAKQLSRQIMVDQGGLPPEVAFRFGGVAEKLDNYLRASLEVMERRDRDNHLFQKSLAVLANLRRDAAEMKPELRLNYLNALHLVNTLYLNVQHSRELAIIPKLKEAGRMVDRIRLESGLGPAMDSFITDVEFGYLNYLAQRDREKFLAKTANNLFQVSRESIAFLKDRNIESQRLIIWGIALFSLLAVGVNIILWRRTRQYFNRFLSSQSQAITAVRNGDYFFNLARRSDDELGDLTAAMNEMAHSLAESENKYQSMVESLNDLVYICSADMEIEYVNPAMGTMLGRDVVGERCYQALHGFEEECPWCERGDDQAFGLIVDVISSPKLNRQFSISRSPLTRKDGSVSTLTVLSDITDKVKMEAQLRQAQKMEALGALAGGMAHDFNNILGAVIGYAELALEDSVAGKTSPEDMAQIIKAADRAKTLVQKILAFSRKAEVKLEPLDVNRVIRDSVSLIERTIPKMISIKFNLGSDLGPVNGDPIQMEQVLLNLAGNAKDAMPDGGELLIETEAVDLDEEYANGHLGLSPGEYIQITVSDTGCGMERKVMEHIFDPFYTTKEVGQGTGLGLASVYGIVKSHQGYILCYSEPGQGTSFMIYFPVLKSGEAPNERTAARSISPDRGAETILLVDDEVQLLLIGSRILGNQGYRVLTAGSGEEALSIYHKRQAEIDLVILDVNMPGMGGRKCLQLIRQLDPRAKIIVASGYSANGPLNDMTDWNISGYLVKPFKKDKLLALIRAALGADRE